MTRRTRRVLQAVLYEAIAVGVIGPGLAFLFDKPAVTAMSFAIFMSAFALVWSYAFNSYFERWESGQTQTTRSFRRRVFHAVGFEGGLVVMLVPIMAWCLETTITAAFIADLGVLAFFFVYSFIFTWSFDWIFGLPESVVRPCTPKVE